MLCSAHNASVLYDNMVRMERHFMRQFDGVLHLARRISLLILPTYETVLAIIHLQMRASICNGKTGLKL